MLTVLPQVEPLCVSRTIWNDVSLFELSTHARLTCEPLPALAEARLLGALGEISTTATCAFDVAAELPATFVAITR